MSGFHELNVQVQKLEDPYSPTQNLCTVSYDRSIIFY